MSEIKEVETKNLKSEFLKAVYASTKDVDLMSECSIIFNEAVNNQRNYNDKKA